AQLNNRLYRVKKFEDGRISFIHHMNSMEDKVLTKYLVANDFPSAGASKFDSSRPSPKLRLSKAAFNFAIEDKHFEVLPDGQIIWLF
ncbi:MAG: hypothetical protein ABI169_11060, partial [Chitinophagaceae bacterium]